MIIYVEHGEIIIKVDNLNYTNRVIEIKNEINKQEYIPSDEQLLLYNNVLMRDLDLISKYITKDYEKINLIKAIKPIDLKFKTMFNKEIIIKNITSQTYIEEIFLLLFYYNDLHPDDIILQYKGKDLDKSRKISYYNIINNSIIHIIIKLKSGF